MSKAHHYRETLSQEGQFLCMAAKGAWSTEDKELLRKHYEQIGDTRTLEIATRNKMLPLMSHALLSAAPSSLSSDWSRLAQANQIRVTNLIDTLQEITETLRKEGCLSAAVEAGGVMLGTQLPQAAYCSGDIDVLVQKQHWKFVLETFERAGFVNQDRRERPTSRVEFCRKSEKFGEQWLEVGYAPFDRMWVPLDYNDRCEQWLSRAVESNKAKGIFVLHPSDALVFAAFHTSLHSFIRAPGLRLQVDVDRLVRDCNIDWDHFVREVRESNLSNRIFVSLAMAKGLVQTPIPEEVLQELQPSAIRWRGISTLLYQNGIIETGSPKLGKLQSLLLDILISEDSLPSWIHQTLLPNEAWMRSHFDRENTHDGSVWGLHKRRLLALASRWKPQ